MCLHGSGIGANTFASTLNGTDLTYNLLSVSANFSLVKRPRYCIRFRQYDCNCRELCRSECYLSRQHGRATAASNILTTRGDLLTVNSSSNVARLAIGASNTFASTLNGTDLTYNALATSANFTGNGL